MSDADSPAIAQHSGNAAAAVPLLILDTQVVMDWLVFDEPSLLPLVSALERGQLRWIATEAMKAELLHVIGRGVAARYSPDMARIHSAFERHCRLVDIPVLGMARPRCSDPDDQKFIDLGLSFAGSQPIWLISRDRAVLKVGKRAAKFGLPILSPAAWLKLTASSG